MYVHVTHRGLGADMECLSCCPQIDVCALGPLRITHALYKAGKMERNGTPAKCIIITSQAGSCEWRFTQNPTPAVGAVRGPTRGGKAPQGSGKNNGKRPVRRVPSNAGVARQQASSECDAPPSPS